MTLKIVAGLTGALALLALAGCDAAPATPEATDTAPAMEAPATTPAAADAAAPAGATAPEGTPAASGAPAFAAIYPGGTLDAPAAQGANGSDRGGMVTYTTEASPQEVIDFYKAHAQTAGLETKVALAQGPMMSYAAGNASNGADMQVIAEALPSGGASVQLSWSAGG